MSHRMLSAALTLAISSSALAQGRIVITEIMYNPASNEKKNEAEWIEIANVGNETVELANWSLKVHEKRSRWGQFTCTLAPGGVAVLINADAVSEEQFRAAWDIPAEDDSAAPQHNYQVLAIKWGGLANDASAEHPLQLINADGEVMCEIKHGAGFPKVTGAGGPSIFLADVSVADVNDGTLWRITTIGHDGARHNTITDVFDKQDIGSPGYVPGLGGNPTATTPVAAKPERKAKDAADKLLKDAEKAGKEATEKAKDVLPKKDDSIDY